MRVITEKLRYNERGTIIHTHNFIFSCISANTGVSVGKTMYVLQEERNLVPNKNHVSSTGGKELGASQKPCKSYRRKETWCLTKTM
jgi:hypothetical protein